MCIRFVNTRATWCVQSIMTINRSSLNRARFAGWQRGVIGALGVALAATVLALPTAAAHASTQTFFEETAEAFWTVPHVCADGSTVEGTLLVKPTRFIEAPETEDPDPTVRLQFLAVCPDGISFSWGAPTAPATITSRKRLKRITATGSGVARDILGATHQVTFSAVWKGVGPVETTVNAPGSTTKRRAARATAHVTFDGIVIVDGRANHPTRPAPFIRVDIEE
jgi:hypothetical protein